MLNSLELFPFKKHLSNINVVFDVGSRDDIDFLNIKQDCEYHFFEPNSQFVNSLLEKLKA